MPPALACNTSLVTETTNEFLCKHFCSRKTSIQIARPYTTIPRLQHPINKDSQSFSRPKTKVDEPFRNNSSTFPSFIGPAAHPSFLSSFPSILSLEEDGLHATFQTRSSWPLPSRDKWGTWETSISTREKTWFSCLPCSAWEYTPSANMATQPSVYLLLFAAASPIFCWKTFCALPFQVQDELIHLCLDCMISATCLTCHSCHIVDLDNKKMPKKKCENSKFPRSARFSGGHLEAAEKVMNQIMTFLTFQVLTTPSKKYSPSSATQQSTGESECIWLMIYWSVPHTVLPKCSIYWFSFCCDSLPARKLAVNMVPWL